jgi:hypothetical protein
MASPFQQYTSGIAPVSGISEAGFNIGRMAQSGLASFGQSLAEGIQKYQENSAENQMIDQEAQGLGQQYQQYLDTFATNDEYAPFTEQLSKYVDKLSKIPEMSLAQKRGALNSAKVAFSNIGNQLQMFNAMKTMNEERAAAEALNPQINPLSEVKDTVLPMALDAFDWSKPYLGNEAGYSNALNNLIAQGANIDKPAKLEEYRKRVEEAATEMSKTNPMGLNILDQVKAARKLDEATSPDVEGYSEAYEAVRTPAYTKTPAEENNQPSQYALAEKVAEMKNRVNNAKPEIYKNIDTVLEQMKSEIASGVTPAEFERNLGNFEQKIFGDLGKNAPLRGSLNGNRYDDWLKNTKEGQLYSEVLPYWKDAVSKIREGIGSSGQGDNTGLMSGYLKNSLKAVLTGELALPSELKNKRTLEDITQPEQRVKSISEINKLQSKINEEKNKASTGTEVTAEDVISESGMTGEKPNQMALKPIDITVPKEVPIAPEVRNQRAIDFMTQRLGYRDANGNLVTPASVNKFFGDMGSGGVKIINNPDGSKFYRIPNDKGGYDNHFVKASDTSAETKTAELSTYGTQDPKSGKLLYEEPIKGLGVMIRGTGKFPSDKDAGNFKEKIAKAAMVVDAMNRVKQIAHDHPVKTKLPWTDARVDIIGEQSKAIAALKEILALDRLSDKDVEIIMSRIPRNEDWMRTPSQTKLQADNVIKDVQSLLYNLGTIYKLDVSIKGQSNSKGGNSTVKELKKDIHR